MGSDRPLEENNMNNLIEQHKEILKDLTNQLQNMSKTTRDEFENALMIQKNIKMQIDNLRGLNLADSELE